MVKDFSAINGNNGRRRGLATVEALAIAPGRVRDIAALRGFGYTFREIAQHYGVTPQAVSLMLNRSRRDMKKLGAYPEFAGLSPRAVAALRRLGITKRSDAANPKLLARLSYARNCGRKTIGEIEAWLAQPESSADSGGRERFLCAETAGASAAQ